MNDEQAALWERISAYRFDREGSSLPFSARLAKDNGWSREFALRAIEEYRRFVFLGVCAGHHVTPSETIDEVWHLHLLYTREYWDRFCADVLGRPFHHEPTQGGPAEAAKHAEQYRKSLASYEAFFGIPAPTDIWPRGRGPEALGARRWALGRNAGRWVKFGGLGLIAPVLVAIGCAESGGSSSPFDYAGPDFLQFYVILYAAGLAVALWARFMLRGSAQGSGADPALNADEVAYLSGGRARATHAAFASLIGHGALQVDQATRRIVPAGSVPPDATPLQQAAFNSAEAGGSVELTNMTAMLGGELDQIDSKLKQAGLLLSDGAASAAVALSLAISSFPVAVGAYKISIGISRDRPVTYLAILCVVSLIVNLAIFARRAFRSRHGDRVLNGLQARMAHLRCAGQNMGEATDPELMMAIGLFGLAALQGTSFAYLLPIFMPPSSYSGTGGNCSTSSGCSSGGGDGGGGGGCGGCSG